MKVSKQLVFIVLSAILLLPAGEASAQNDNLEPLIEKAQEAGIEQSSLSELQSRAQSEGMNTQQFKQILQSALEMSRQNLPADMAIDKALEGFSKGIPNNRIVPVVHRVQQSMGESVKIVDPWLNQTAVQQMLHRSADSMPQQEFRNEMVRAASKSLRKNIAPGNINNILSEMGSDSVMSNATPADMVAALDVLSDISTSPEQPGVSASFIVLALQAGFNADNLRKLPAALKMGQQRSQLPASSVIEGVGRQMKGGIPAKQILQNLFNGKVGGEALGNNPGGAKHSRPGQGGDNGETG